MVAYKEMELNGLRCAKTSRALTACKTATGRLDPSGQAYNWQSGGDVRLNFGLPQLTCNQTPAVGIRRLTPVECSRLQGFPDDWTEGQSDSARYRMLGNAVAVPCAEWIARRIVRVARTLPLPLGGER